MRSPVHLRPRRGLVRVYKTVSLLVRLKSQVTIGNPYGQHSGYLHQAPIDQPVLARNCQMQLLDSWEAHSKLLGLTQNDNETLYVICTAMKTKCLTGRMLCYPRLEQITGCRRILPRYLHTQYSQPPHSAIGFREMLQAASLALERLIWIVKCHQECCGE